MTLLLLLGVGGAGAAVTAWGGSADARAARVGAVAGTVALIVVLVLALAMNVPAAVGGDGGTVRAGAGLFADRIVPTDYLRLAVALWALDSVLLIAVAWLLGGLAGLRGVLAASLVAITAGAVALGATDLALGVAAATLTGLAGLLTILAVDRASTVPTAARELRTSLLAGVAVLGAVAIAPVAGSLALGAGAGALEGPGTTVASAVDEAGAVVGIALLAIVIAIAMRGGAIPFHVRVSRLVDVAPPIAVPLLFAWIPLPLAVVGLAAVDRLVAPLALPLEGEHALVVGLALFTLLSAALAAFIQDDLRHSIGYLIVADGGLVLLGFAALDPAAWGPTRTWLVALAVSKSALGAWAAVVESRFETRSLPDLRGWIRRAPMLAAALALVVVATYGIPGWVAFASRADLARLAAGSSWQWLLMLAGFLTLPAYIRLLAIGMGPASTPVARAVPERIMRGPRPSDRLVVEREGGPRDAENRDAPAGAVPSAVEARTQAAAPETGLAARLQVAGRGVRLRAAGSGSVVRGLAEAIRRDRAELLSAAVLALAVLAALTSWGALGVGGASSEPAPIVSGPSAD